ncbi:MAG TPA: metalloprotease PmbA, partial [Burkholderiales bacterium]|nr:metalloprotease PmbA [Burkholderiales bacterium]
MSSAVDAPAQSRNQFANDPASLKQIVADVLKYARERGATACEAEVSEGLGQTVTVRHREVETIEYNRDKSMGISVYIGQRRGHASTSDFSPQAVRATADAALSIAKFTASDEYAGLADEQLLARDIPDLDLYHPWDLPVERAIELACSCEDAAFAIDKRISNSEGATVSLQQSHFAYGNSLGFLAGYPSSRHWISCAVIAGKGDAMQRDDWYTSAREPAGLDAPELVGKIAGTRALARLGAKKIPTAQVPVLFEAPVAASLLGHFVSAVSGGSLYRKSSFLVDSLGKQIFSPLVEITEDPLIVRGEASTPFDEEGVATRRRAVVEAGVLRGYFLGSYSARKLGMQTTGNAGGTHNLLLKDSGQDLPQLLRQMGRGLLVTEMLGSGINMVTGDFSRGAAGFWVEN